MSRESAGGQLEHPSEVNNSTRTGVDPAAGGCVVAGVNLAALPVMPESRAIRARNTMNAAITATMPVRKFMAHLFRSPSPLLIRNLPAKRMSKLYSRIALTSNLHRHR